MQTIDPATIPALAPPSVAAAGWSGRLQRLWHHARGFWHWRVRHSLDLPYLPTEIGLELTNRCNFRCAFCPQSNPQHFDLVPRVTLTPEQARVLLGKIRDGGVTTGILHWTLDGEPFMNRQFDAIVSAAAELGFDTHHFASNGYFTTRARLATFPRGPEQRYFVCTDFCVDADFFEKHRGTPGSWQVVHDNLIEVLGDPDYANFHFLVTDISSFAVHDRFELDRRFEALQALFPPSDRLRFLRRVFHNSCGTVEIDKPRGSYHLCPYPWFSFHIASNGEVVACCRDLEHKTVLGNLFEEDFRSIWNGDRYRALRRALVERRPEDMSACAGCDMPYDDSKFSLRNLAKSAVHRALLLRRIGPGGQDG